MLICTGLGQLLSIVQLATSPSEVSFNGVWCAKAVLPYKVSPPSLPRGTDAAAVARDAG